MSGRRLVSGGTDLKFVEIFFREVFSVSVDANLDGKAPTPRRFDGEFMIRKESKRLQADMIFEKKSGSFCTYISAKLFLCLHKKYFRLIYT